MPASSRSPSGGSPEGSRGGGWVVAQALLLAAAVVGGLVGPGWEVLTPWLGVPVGALLLALGTLLALAGVRDLGPSLSPFPRPRGRGELVERGVYARVRHPIYGGLILAAFGWAFLTVSLVSLVLAAVLVAFFVLKSRREEELLLERYEGYEEYRRRTPRRLLPWLL